MDQAYRLRALRANSGSEKFAKIISVTSGKGGVGKSNIAANLAVNFVKRGIKTLLIDADIGLANANLLLGCRVEYTLDNVMFDNVDMQNIFVRTPFGFDLLPSSSGIRRLLELDQFSQRVLFDRLQVLMRGYDVVLYDTAPGIGSHVLNFNASANDIVVVAHPEPTALADAYALIKVLAQEKKEKYFKLLINRARNPKFGLDAFKKLTDVSNEFLNISVDYLGVLPEDSFVNTAVVEQRPISIAYPRAAFSLALDRVADKLLASKSYNQHKNMWNNGMSQRRSGTFEGSSL